MREAFLAVPRDHFVPDRAWWPQRGTDGGYPLMGRTRRPHQWLKAVYRPGAPLVTQIDDGAVRPEASTSSDAFTSSISCSCVVVSMLCHLGPQPGDSVLEIGTGTGYNTALLCHRLGDQAVTSIEVNPGLAATASQRLKDLGVHPHLVTRGGAEGHAAKAPYDRLLPTACVQRVPPPWILQVRAGGRILTTLTIPLGIDALLALTVDGATSRLLTAVNFMLLRSQRQRQPWKELGWPRLADLQSASTTTDSTSAYRPLKSGPLAELAKWTDRSGPAATSA